MSQRYGIYFAWVLACMGILLSLYFSEIRHLQPCNLCWFQRVFLFPLAIILGIAAYQGNRTIALYVLPLTIIGLLVASYQIAIQSIPGWNPIDICGAGPNCAEKIDIGLGFITIPMLSAANFLTISALVFVSYKSK